MAHAEARAGAPSSQRGRRQGRYRVAWPALAGLASLAAIAGVAACAPATAPGLVGIPPGMSVKQIAGGCYHTMALTSSGQVLTWGKDNQGQLGDGSGQSSFRPVPVHLPAGLRVQAVAAGRQHTIALTVTGQVFGWG